MTPRTAPTKLDTAALHALVIAQFPTISDIARPNSRPALLVPAADLPAVARFVRDDARIRCDSLMDLGGVDRLKEPGAKKGEFPHSTLVVMYHLHSLVHFHKLTLRVELPRDAATVPTVGDVWPVAGWWEREVFDLFGITFAGHPDLRRLMTPSDWTGHPLRKDYVYPTEYNAIPLRREGQRFADGPYA